MVLPFTSIKGEFDMQNKRKTILIATVFLFVFGLINSFSNDEVDENEIEFEENETEEQSNTSKEELESRKGIEEDMESTSEASKESEVNSRESINDNPFPQTEKYIVNNTLIEYNKIAEYPIDDKFIQEMIEVERPLSKITYTLSNGVYFILLYNDYNRTLFIDYQEETSDDSALYAVVRDMSKAIKPEMSDEDVELLIESVKNGTVKNYFDNSIEPEEFGFAVIKRELNGNITSYFIRCKYGLK